MGSFRFLDADQQIRLAELVNAALPCDILLHELRSINDPLPQLALAIAGAIGRGLGLRSELEYLETYHSPIEGLTREQRRHLLALESEQARCSSVLCRPDFDELYRNVIAKCSRMLGPTDQLTLDVRLAYSRQLRVIHGRTADSAVIYIAVMHDLLDLHRRIVQDPTWQDPTRQESDAWVEECLNSLVDGIRGLSIPGYPLVSATARNVSAVVISQLASSRVTEPVTEHVPGPASEPSNPEAPKRERSQSPAIEPLEAQSQHNTEPDLHDHKRPKTEMD